MSYFSSVQISGLELNDGVQFLTPFPQDMDSMAAATPRLQQVMNGPPVYTGQVWAEKTIVIHINVIPKPGDAQYQDFYQKLYLLKQAFDTRYQYLSTLRVQNPGQVAKTVQGTAKGFSVNKEERYVEVQFVVPDGIWYAEDASQVTQQVQSSGQNIIVTSNGNSDTFPTITLGWSVSKFAVNPNGSFYTFQIPITITNNALVSVQRHPVEITGFLPPPTLSAAVGTGGSIPAGTVTLSATVQRTNTDQSGGETNACTPVSVTVSASGKVAATILTVPDALSYNVFAGTGGNSRTWQANITQPNLVIQSDGQLRVPASVSITLSAVTSNGRAEPTVNTTGWNHAALVSAGQAAADGSDVRVLIGGVPSPFKVVAPNTANTRVWVLMDMGVAEQDVVYLQWGNRNPPAVQSNTVSATSADSAQPTGPVAPPAETIPIWLPSDEPLIDFTNSNNYAWTWPGTFFDYINLTRPGSWQPISSVGVGYNYKQDNTIVKRGTLTSYGTPTGLVNGTFSTNTLTGWATTGTWGVDTSNGHFGGSNYSAFITGSGTISQTFSVTPGVAYAVTAAVWSSQADATFTVKDGNGTTLFTWTSTGISFYEQAQTVKAGLIGVQPFTISTSTATIELTTGGGVYRLTDVALYPAADVYTLAPLDDPQDNIASVMGLLHSTVAINDLEVPLNGWSFQHPAGIRRVTHYGLTALTGFNNNGDNVLRLIGTDQSFRPDIVYGQPYLTPAGPVPYATAQNPRVDTLPASRQAVQFQINASVPSDPINGDGSFCCIQGVTCDFNPQHTMGLSFAPVQQFYDLNCNITQNTKDAQGNLVDGDVMTIATNLEKDATLQIDTQNKLVWHIDKAGNKELRGAALTLNTLRPYWMQIHPGANTLVYTEDVVGNVSVNVSWRDSWS